MVDFGASWCDACKELERKTFDDPRVVREGDRFIPVRIDLSPGQANDEKRAPLRLQSSPWPGRVNTGTPTRAARPELIVS
jgi:hypothetical protein